MIMHCKCFLAFFYLNDKIDAMTGKEFAAWLDVRGLSPAEGAALFGISEQNIYNWRSTRGVPPSKAEWVLKTMTEYEKLSVGTLPNRVILEPTRDQFRAWGKAALAAGKLIDDWAAETLDDVAAEDEAAKSTGYGDRLNPLQSMPRAAEPGNEYRTASDVPPGTVSRTGSD